MKIRFVVLLIALVLNSVSVFSQAKRIVSLAPSLTKQLYLLGVENKIVGCTSYCEEAKKEGKPVVASAIDVNVEKVLTLKPDLVITSSLTKPSTINTLEKLGIKVAVYPYPKSFDDMNRQFFEIAGLVGEDAKGKKVVAEQKKRLEKALLAIPKGKRKKMFMQIGAKPLFTVVPNTFMQDYIDLTGGENVASHLKIGSISREAVLLSNPDVIFIVTMGVVGEEEKKRWGTYGQLSAVKNKKIFIIDSTVASTPTPKNFVDTVIEMVRLLYS